MAEREIKIEQEAAHAGSVTQVGYVEHFHEAPPAPPLSPHERRNRERMIDKVDRFWVQGVLEKSLHHEVLLDLAMTTAPQTSTGDYPWELELHTPDDARPLPAGSTMRQVYHELGGELLVLGAPGSGKTTMLLDLARSLLAEAAHDDTAPLPVVLNLASWADHRQTLAWWLVEELHTLYQVPRQVGRAWLASDALTLLLDGLDEVGAAAREDCVRAINAFRGDHAVGLVVCSRQQEYDQLQEPLRCHAAVVVQPLTEAQVNEYLHRVGAASLAQALATDATLRELAETPLMLSLMVLAYQDQPHDPAAGPEQAAPRRQHLLALYVQRMLARKVRAADKPYPDAQTMHWLAWLARQLRQHDQPLFLLERLQPAWLATRRAVWLHRLLTLLAVLLLIGVPLGVFIRFATYSVPAGVATGLGIGLAAWLALRRDFRWSAAGLLGLAWGVTSSVIITALSENPTNGLIVGLINAPVGMVVWRLAGRYLMRERDRPRDTIRPVERMRWSWRRAGLGLAVSVLIVAFFTVIWVASTPFEPYTPRDWPRWITYYGYWQRWPTIFIYAQQQQMVDTYRTLANNPVTYGLRWGALYTLLFGMAVTMFVGLTPGAIEQRARPNQGIWRSARNAIQFGLTALVVFGISWATLRELAWRWATHNGWDFALLETLVVSLIEGAAIGLAFGGFAVIQHGLLRLLLMRAGRMPRHYARFLDYCADRLLLRKVGGGYIFVHRLLLDYFAELPAPDLEIPAD